MTLEKNFHQSFIKHCFTILLHFVSELLKLILITDEPGINFSLYNFLNTILGMKSLFEAWL